MKIKNKIEITEMIETPLSEEEFHKKFIDFLIKENSNFLGFTKEMEERKLIYPAIYKHFKGKYYATIGLVSPMNKKEIDTLIENFKEEETIENITCMYALHTETQEHIQIIKVDDELKYLDYYSRYNEKLVLYKSLYDDAIPYVRPYDMFMSEVDKEKYPNVEQKYRLELVRY